MPKASKKPSVKSASTRVSRSGAAAAKAAKSSPERARAPAPRGRAAQPAKNGRGRPPKRVFINVLVRETTRAELTRLKGSWGIPSQGEVIDALVADAGSRAPARKRGS